MAETITKTLWSEFNGKGFEAESAKYAERASCDAMDNDLTLTITNSKVNAIGGCNIAAETAIKDSEGNLLKTTYATKSELSTKQDALPQSSANQYLITDANNDFAWGNIPTVEPAKVHILSKTTDFTLSEFNEIWDWLGNGHIVGVYRKMNFALIDMDCLYLARQRYTSTYGKTIAFVFDKINTDWDNNDNSSLVAYLGLLVWRSTYNTNSISFTERTMIPEPTNNQNKFLFCNGSGGFSYVPAFRVTASSDSSFTAVSGTSNILNVNSSRGYLGAGTSLHKYLMLDESNVTDASDDGKLVTLDYNNGNFKLGLSSVNSVPSATAADEGKLLSVNSQGTPAWTTVPGYATDPTIDDSLLLGQSDGSKTWTALQRDAFGTEVLDSQGRQILDEEGGAEYDSNATDDLWTSFNDHEFGARRAYEDQDGRNIKATYAATADFSRELFGSVVLDAHGVSVVDEETGEVMYDNDSTDQLWTSFSNHEFGARRAYEDQDGNNIVDTYARKDEATGGMDESSVADIDGMFIHYGHVVIGGRRYKTVTIGNQEWLAENLDYKFDGLIVNQPEDITAKMGNYYNNDEATYGRYGNKYGLLYNWLAVNHIETNRATLLPTGWRVPSESDWNTLATAVGGLSVAGTNLKSVGAWSSGSGDDTYGMSIYPSGHRYMNDFSSINIIAEFWSSTVYAAAQNRAMFARFNASAEMSITDNSKDNGYSVRLVRTIS